MNINQLLSKGFNPKTYRLLIDLKALNKLPFKKINKEEEYEVMESWYFNPTHYYPTGAKKKRNEIGYDDKFRYIAT